MNFGAGADDVGSSDEGIEDVFHFWHVSQMLFSPYVPVFQSMDCKEVEECGSVGNDVEVELEVGECPHAICVRCDPMCVSVVHLGSGDSTRTHASRTHAPSAQPQASLSYMVDFDAFATANIKDYDWHLKYYKLASRNISIEPADFAPGRQHALPLLRAESVAWDAPKRGGGRGRVNPLGRARGRGRGAGAGESSPDESSTSSSSDSSLSSSGSSSDVGSGGAASGGACAEQDERAARPSGGLASDDLDPDVALIGPELQAGAIAVRRQSWFSMP